MGTDETRASGGTKTEVKKTVGTSLFLGEGIAKRAQKPNASAKLPTK